MDCIVFLLKKNVQDVEKKMICDECAVEKCDTRNVLKRYNNPKLISIVEKNCDEFKHTEDKGNNS